MALADEEVTEWIVRLNHGDERAAHLLWQRYFDKLTRYARRKMGGMPRRAADEEDVALSAMHSFFRGMAGRRFDRLNDRHDLWKLLVLITARKACKQRRLYYSGKRGGGHVRGESAFLRVNCGEEGENDGGIAAVLGSEPTPEFAAKVAENCRQLLDRLGDENLRQVALYTFEGFTTVEIAGKLRVSQRSVQRKLNTIREIWSEAAPK